MVLPVWSEGDLFAGLVERVPEVVVDGTWDDLSSIVRLGIYLPPILLFQQHHGVSLALISKVLSGFHHRDLRENSLVGFVSLNL